MSVSRRAGPPHFGHVTFTKSGTRAGRATLLRDLDLRRQNDGQLVVGHRNQAVALAMNHWDGRAPIALAAHAPILQAKCDLRLAKAPAAAISWSFFWASTQLSPLYSPELMRTPSSTVKGSAGSSASGLGGGNHASNRNRILGRKLEVALIVRGHAHDGAGAVFRQNVVGHPDGHAARRCTD